MFGAGLLKIVDDAIVVAWKSNEIFLEDLY
jgi:hypothetical protein